MTKDKYKIPLKEAQDWCRNWINLDEAQAGMDEKDKHKTTDMRAFLIAKEDLKELFEQVPDARYVRFYVGLHDEEGKDGKTKKIPHLLTVNARGDSPKNARDVVGPQGDNSMDGDDVPVNDVSHPCPRTCDEDSPMYV